MSGGRVYLDHAATTPLRPEVVEAVLAAERDGFANPSSLHAAGRRARTLLEDARERLVALLGGRATGPARDRLVFTSGATEANRLGVLGPVDARPREEGPGSGGPPGTVLVSARDHTSVHAAARELATRGWRSRELPLGGATGTLAGLEPAAIPPGRVLLTSALVCGQTGIRENLAAIGSLRAGRGDLRVHVDATQALPFEARPFADLPAESLACAAHKLGGPRGIGALLARSDLPLGPLVPGPQEGGLRGGTEPVGLAVGFARACELAVSERDAAAARITTLRARFEAGVMACYPTAVVVGRTADRAPHVSTIAFPGCERQDVVIAADLAGLCCSTGTACASGSSEPAPALLALGLPPELVRGAVRFSLGHDTRPEEIDRALGILRVVLARPQGAGRRG